MVQSAMKVTKTEKLLLETLAEMRFGEIYGLELMDEPTTEVVMVTAAQRSLIRNIWGGMRNIGVLSVHQGDPVLAEVDCKINGFRCRKKYKFPTE